jgi:hypothetical protein
MAGSLSEMNLQYAYKTICIINWQAHNKKGRAKPAFS